MKRPPGCDFFIMYSVDQDLTAALKALAEATDAARAAAPASPGPRPSRQRRADGRTIGQSLCMLMPEKAILVDEAATWHADPRRQRRSRADYLAPDSGGAIGGGLPLALGAAIAYPDRKVVHLQADGCGMYTVQALWTMARQKTDIVIVVSE